MPNCRMLVLTAAVAAANFAGTASAQEAAGTVLWSMGQVERLSAAGTAKVLSKGDEVFEGDTIRAAAGAHAQLRMRDEALLAVRPDSQMRLETYAYRGAEDGTERAVIELIKGGMRSITGAVGRNNKENVLTRTPTVLIGIRGTDHETFVTSEGTYDRVSVGGTYLQSAGGRLDLDAGQIGFASLTAGAGPSRLDRTPEFMQIAAIVNGNTGPALRLDSSGDRGRLAKDLPGAALRGAAPAVPAAVLVDGKGGRCGGPCSDPLLNPGLGYGKGKGKGKP